MVVKQSLLWVLMLSLLAVSGVSGAQKEEEKKGTVIGVVTAKGDGPLWIEVKADGEEKARRYTKGFGGNVATPKDVEELMKSVAVGTRVKLEWTFSERPRVMKLEVLKKDEKKDK